MTKRQPIKGERTVHGQGFTVERAQKLATGKFRNKALEKLLFSLLK